jgi:hypothetical protein
VENRCGPGAGPGTAPEKEVRSGAHPPPDEAAEGWCCEHLPTALIANPVRRLETRCQTLRNSIRTEFGQF